MRRPAVRAAAQITPWNNPLAVPAGKLAPALRLACAVVWKPSPLAPATAAALLEILGLAGLSEDLVAVVDGGADVAEAVIEAAPVDAVSLTRSPSGWKNGAKLAPPSAVICFGLLPSALATQSSSLAGRTRRAFHSR